MEESAPVAPVDFLFLLSPFLLVPPASPPDLPGHAGASRMYTVVAAST